MTCSGRDRVRTTIMSAMTRLLRRCVAHRLLCLLMAWVMAVAPMIVLAGEVHELEHLHPRTALVTDDGAPTDANGGDLLHELADAAQCCNHIAAVLPAA